MRAIGPVAALLGHPIYLEVLYTNVSQANRQGVRRVLCVQNILVI